MSTTTVMPPQLAAFQLAPPPEKLSIAADHEVSTRFLLTMGQALHTYGCSSPEIEEHLRRCAQVLHASIDVSSTPTALFVAVETEGGQNTSFLRLEPGHVNCEKQTLLSDVLRRFLHLELSPSDGIAEIQAIVARPRRYRALTQLLAGGMTSTGIATLMGGNLLEIIVAGGLGTVVGASARWMRDRPRLTTVYEPICGFIAGATAAGASSIAALNGASLHPSLVSLAGIITLLPGLMLTLGIRELTAQHLTSGTARLVGAASTLLLLCVGVALGVRVGLHGASIAGTSALPVSWQLEALMATLSAFALVAFFNARPRDIPAVTLVVLIGFFSGRLGDSLLGAGLGAGVGAFSVIVVSNLLGRIRQTPGTMTLLPGLILLLPSSFGFQSFESLLHGNIGAGIEAAFSMVITAVSLVTGLLLGAAAVPEQTRPLRRAEKAPQIRNELAMP